MAVCKITEPIDKISKTHNNIMKYTQSLYKDVQKSNKNLPPEDVYDIVNSMLEYNNIPPGLHEQMKPSMVYRDTLKEKDIPIDVYKIEKKNGIYKLLYLTKKEKQARTVYVNTNGRVVTKNGQLNQRSKNTLFDMNNLQESYDVLNKQSEQIDSQNQFVQKQADQLRQQTISFDAEAGSKFDYTRENATVISAHVINNMTKAEQIFDDIKQATQVKVSKEHEQMLRETLRTMTDDVQKIIPNMIQVIKKHQPTNYGKMVLSGNNKGIWIGISDGARIAGNQMSPMEMYVHELKHATLEYALRYKKNFIAKELRAINGIYKQFLEHVTVQDFMPSLENSVRGAFDNEQKIAEARLEYLKDPEFGLHEFMVMVDTNPIVKKVLQERVVVKKRDVKVENLWDRVVALVLKVWDFAIEFFEGSDVGLDGATAMAKHLQAIQNINNVAVSDIEHHNIAVQRIAQMLEYMNTYGYKQIKRFMAYIRKTSPQSLDEEFYKKAREFENHWSEKNIFQKTKFLVHMYSAWISSSKIEDIGSFETWMHLGPGGILRGFDVDFFKPEGDIQQLIRGFRNSDREEEMTEKLGLQANKIEKNIESVANAQSMLVKQLFPKSYTKEDFEVMTRGVLDIELDSLVSNTMFNDKHKNRDFIVDVLRSDDKLGSAIVKTEQLIDASVKNKKRANFIINQAIGLGRYMVTGKAAKSQLSNSYIINGFDMTNREVKDIIAKNEEPAAEYDRMLIDRLATLYAIAEIDKNTKNRLAEIVSEQYDSIIDLMNYDKNTREEYRRSEEHDHEYDMERVKGWHHKFTANWISYKVDRKTNIAINENDNYKQADGLTFDPNYKVYFRTDFSEPGWKSEGVRTTNDGMHIQSYVNIEKPFLIEDYDKNALKDSDELKAKVRNLLNKQQKSVFKEMSRLYEKRYIKQEYHGMRPIFKVGTDQNLFLSDFDMNIDKHLIEEQTRTMNGADIVLGRTYARAVDIFQSKKNNENILNFMEADALKNYDYINDMKYKDEENTPSSIASSTGSENMMEYVRIGPYEENTLSREIWPVLPRYFKIAIMKRSFNIKKKAIVQLYQDHFIGEDIDLTC